MCGIAGYMGTRIIPPEREAACLALMARRGPDARGAYRHETAAGTRVLLLHSRLAIIDLERRADQPFLSGDKALIFNGEIYNYLEIKDDLRAQGHIFKTRSDTEALMALLAGQGRAGLARCEGMWALGLYDRAEGSLLLSRDRFGEKPLYLFRDPTGLFFGSEPKFIFALLGRTPPVNRRHLCRYLVNGYKSLYKTRETFFQGLEELPPGACLELDREGRESLSRYWSPRLDQEPDLDLDQAVQGTRELLARAVEIRLRADVPLAFCMSGGVDSNALIATAARLLGRETHGFTIVNIDERYAEQDLVDLCVAELGVRHTPVALDKAGFLPRLRDLVRAHDAPVYTISYYAHWLLMEQIAARGYKISISGTGADELFSGYYDHQSMYLAEVAGDRDLFERALADWRAHVKPVVRNPLLQDPLAFVNDPGQRGHIFLDAAKFASWLRPDFDEPFSETRYCPGLLKNRMLNELFHESVPVILHEDDLNAMYFSVENRSPFLDRALFEHCLRIPTRLLVRDGRAKAVLRLAMRGVVPDAVLDSRRKVGFNAPILDLLDTADPEVRAEVLAPGLVFDLVRRDRIEALLAVARPTNSQSKFLFNFLCAKMFLEEFER
ncbi:MAG: asparagine synthase (glutamine-hydrolyzing) [Desulfovibrionaceae bacterium]|nr:asparagine synthase (glutamine-hydrolyzing) [Desulfovibrionaceae bacterium]